MNGIKKWIDERPILWEFIKFNILSNCATVTNFVVMWICTRFIFKSFSDQPFGFNYDKAKNTGCHKES